MKFSEPVQEILEEVGLDVPKWILKILANPAREGGRHTEIIKFGPALLRCGYSTKELEALCEAVYNLKQSEIRKLPLNGCLRYAAESEDDNFCKEEYKKKKAKEQLLVFRARQNLKTILTNYTWNVNHIKEDYPEFSSLTLQDQRHFFLEFLFDEEDTLWIGDIFNTGEKFGSGHFKTRNEWLDMQIIPWEFTSHSIYKEDIIDRTNENVVKRKYMVIESDTLTMDEMGSVVLWLEEEHGLNLAALVTSGKKSLHAWFDFVEPIDDWKAFMVGLQCDPATFKPSQPVRLPGIIRKNTGKPQELLYLRT